MNPRDDGASQESRGGLPFALAAPRRWLRHAADLFLSLEHVRVPLLVLLGLTLIASVAYCVLLGVGPVDGFYQASTTLSTVGFREVRPFDNRTKLFTSVLILLGVGTVFYTITLLAATVVEGDLRRNFRRRVTRRRMEGMEKHHVICGFGRVGEAIAREFLNRRVEFVVIDADREALDRAEAIGCHALQGDATGEEVLRRAGADRARCLLAATDSDPKNIYITLTAKNLNPSIYVIARSAGAVSEEKLRLAGADRVVSPYAIGGRRMVLSALQPMITDFIDVLSAGRHGELILAELEVASGSSLEGAALSEAFAEAPSTKVLGVSHEGGGLVVGPAGKELLRAGDIVIVLADEGEIGRLDANRRQR